MERYVLVSFSLQLFNTFELSVVSLMVVPVVPRNHSIFLSFVRNNRISRKATISFINLGCKNHSIQTTTGATVFSLKKGKFPFHFSMKFPCNVGIPDFRSSSQNCGTLCMIQNLLCQVALFNGRFDTESKKCKTLGFLLDFLKKTRLKILFSLQAALRAILTLGNAKANQCKCYAKLMLRMANAKQC